MSPLYTLPNPPMQSILGYQGHTLDVAPIYTPQSRNTKYPEIPGTYPGYPPYIHSPIPQYKVSWDTRDIPWMSPLYTPVHVQPQSPNTKYPVRSICMHHLILLYNVYLAVALHLISVQIIIVVRHFSHVM